MNSAATVIAEVLKEAGVTDPRSLTFDVIERLDGENLIIIRKPIAPEPPAVSRCDEVPDGMSEQQLLLLDAITYNVYAWVPDSQIIARRFVTAEITGDIAWLEANGLFECRGAEYRTCRITDLGHACLAAARAAGWEGVQAYVTRYFQRPITRAPR